MYDRGWLYIIMAIELGCSSVHHRIHNLSLVILSSFLAGKQNV